MEGLRTLHDAPDKLTAQLKTTVDRFATYGSDQHSRKTCNKTVDKLLVI